MLPPTLGNIWTPGVLADGVQTVSANDVSDLRIALPAGNPNLQPVGMTSHSTPVDQTLIPPPGMSSPLPHQNFTSYYATTPHEPCYQ